LPILPSTEKRNEDGPKKATNKLAYALGICHTLAYDNSTQKH